MMLGNFSCFCCLLLTVFKINFLKKSFRNTIRVTNSLGPDHDRHSVGPDLCPVCKIYQQTTKAAVCNKRVKLTMTLAICQGHHIEIISPSWFCVVFCKGVLASVPTHGFSLNFA